MDSRRYVGMLIDETLQACAARRRPFATYRLQFHSHFTFRDAARLAPYLRDLGISHVYASPFLKARPGSTHGYDITDHRELNPEIGTSEDYAAYLAALKQNGLSQILDTVPNHMGIIGNENPWWNDVLENGAASQHAEYFDIAWDASPRPELRGRLLLPVLAEPYGKVLEAGQLRLEYAAGSLTLVYFTHRIPIDPGTYDRVLSYCLPEPEVAAEADDLALDEHHIEYYSIVTAVRNLPGQAETDAARNAERQREKEVIKRRLAQLTEASAEIADHVTRGIAAINGQAGDAHSFDRLHELLDQQPYRLAFWRVATDEINYRRFFDVNELAALSMERPEVFEAAHELTLRLAARGDVDGLRVDHPDGLFNPREYLERLQFAYVLACAREIHERDAKDDAIAWNDIEPLLREEIAQRFKKNNESSKPLYLLVEKILGRDEPLRADWLVHGTSGYDFLTMLSGLFVDETAQKEVTKLYRDWIGNTDTFEEIVYQKKSLILRVSLASELYMLAHHLDRLAQKTRWTRDFTLTTLRHALRETIACFPVYRSYLAEGQVQDADRAYVHTAIRRAKARVPAISTPAFNFIQDMLLLHYPESADEEARAEQRRFVGKFEQVTAPVTAKGVEDTAFYVFNRFVSLNEVGGDPGRFGITPAELHRYFGERQQQWPLAMSATSTHDTKRSEDVRARLNVLSEMPEEWLSGLTRLSQLSECHRQQADNDTVPDANEEFLLYQTLLGAWPVEPYSAEEFSDFTRRLQDYMVKSLHEAKIHSSWINPNETYDAAMRQFVAGILSDHERNPFIAELLPLVRRISHFGMLNSLAQLLVKITAPGVPDFYQGTETWDFSLVDPDNRRPVDYARRGAMLRELLDKPAGDRARQLRQLLASKEDGRIKMHVTNVALCCRHEHDKLFTGGDYLPLETAGTHARHLFAFARRWQGRSAIVVVPRLLSHLVQGKGALPLDAEVWGDTELKFPQDLSAKRWYNVLTDASIEKTESKEESGLRAAKVLAVFPIALLISS